MKRKIIAGIVILILGAGVLLFYFLGGFNPIQIQSENLGQIKLSGLQFRGRPQDEGLKKTFEKIEDLLKLYPQAKLHTIYFEEPAGKMDTMEVFVGLESIWVNEMEGLNEISLDASKAIVATLSAHRFAMPGPLRVQSKISDFAQGNGLSKPEIFIDQIIGPNEVKVIGLSK